MIRLSDPVSSHLIGLDRSVRESEVRSANQIAENKVRESVGGRGSPNSDSLAHGLSTFVM